MREMKYSGAEYVGDIPFDWEAAPLKYHFYISKRIAGEPGHDVLSITQKGLKVRDLTDFKGQLANDYSNYQLVEPGDFAMNHMDLLTGWIDCSDKYGVTSPDYRVFKIRREDFCKHYFLYFFQTCYSARIFYGFGKGIAGVGRWRLPADRFKNTIIPVPPIPEQERIAFYLNEKCAEIDRAIEAAEASIAEYELYRKSVIFQAVTKGLDDSVEMKDSGIEWIGDIPNSWNTCLVDSMFVLRNTTVSDSDFSPLSVTKQGVLPQLSHVAKSDDHSNRKLVCKGDFAINSRSDRRNSCGFSNQDGSVSLINIVLQPRREFCTRYYEHLFNTVQFGDEFYSFGHGIVADLWTTNWNFMRKIELPEPSLCVQFAIADYLDKTTHKIEQAIESKQQIITELKAYKKSLIYEVVTGKREV